MGVLNISIGSGGGVSSDETTVRANQVLQDQTYLGADTDDEIGVGKMPNRGAVSQALNAGGSYTIPEGYHNGQGKVTANSLASQTGGVTATDAQVLTNYTYWKDGAKRTGTMPNQGAKTSSLNCGGSYTIPAGYHNGSGKITANSLASQTSANATASTILSGYNAWVNGNKISGNVTVQSILSFSAAPYSSTQITFTWKNPAKGAFSGVIIRGKTGSCPTSVSDGTQYYKGYGSNKVANGTSSATVGGFAKGTTYYFRAFSYAVKSGSDWVHETSKTATAATTKGQQVFTSNGTFTVPAGVRSIDIFCVGGGACGSYGNNHDSVLSDDFGGAGGGGGYTATKKDYAVTPGQTFAITIGAGAVAYNPRGTSTIEKTYGGTTSFASVISASGGKTGYSKKTSGTMLYNTSGRYGGDGGSGGGTGGGPLNDGLNGGNGGSNGGNGDRSVNDSNPSNSYFDQGGIGQGTTTRAFGDSSGTLYSGGGGGGSGQAGRVQRKAVGGSGGGGAGAWAWSGSESSSFTAPVPGSANTGGGGGGGASGYSASSSYDSQRTSANGGSGICIVRWGY